MSTKKVAKKVAKKATKKSTAKKTTPKKSTAKKTTATKKSAAKKAAPKKTKKVAKKSTAKKAPLKTAEPEQAFWLANGEILHTLVDLAEVLRVIDETVYAYHVDDSRNDFADWVEHVLADIECARDLRQCQTHSKACGVVEERLKIYIV